MCKGKDCNKKDNCYRFTARSSEYWQSYFDETPIKKDGSCDEYWPISSKSILKRIEIQKNK